MAVRVRYKVTVTVSSTTAEDKDLGNATYEVVNDKQGEGGSWKTTVIGGATDVQLQLPNVADAKFLVIRTVSKDPTIAPVTLNFKRNSAGGEALPVAIMTDSKEGLLMLTTTGLTALYVTNTSGSVVMEVTLIVAGD